MTTLLDEAAYSDEALIALHRRNATDAPRIMERSSKGWGGKRGRRADFLAIDVRRRGRSEQLDTLPEPSLGVQRNHRGGASIAAGAPFHNRQLSIVACA
ncbi:MAG TPA: hypothetical protein VGL42_00635 [Opitutaceae bacterium]